jgi:hypothetical protein
MAFHLTRLADLQVLVPGVRVGWEVLQTGIVRRGKGSLVGDGTLAIALRSQAVIKANCNLPVDGLSPNCTICLKLTPVAGKPE